MTLKWRGWNFRRLISSSTRLFLAYFRLYKISCMTCNYRILCIPFLLFWNTGIDMNTFHWLNGFKTSILRFVHLISLESSWTLKLKMFLQFTMFHWQNFEGSVLLHHHFEKFGQLSFSSILEKLSWRQLF